MGRGGKFRFANGAQVGVQGGWAINGGASLVSVDGSGKETAMSPNHNGAYTDPLSSYTAPSKTGLTIQSMSPVSYGKNNPPPSNTLQPGIHCGAITVTD